MRIYFRGANAKADQKSADTLPAPADLKKIKLSQKCSDLFNATQ